MNLSNLNELNFNEMAQIEGGYTPGGGGAIGGILSVIQSVVGAFNNLLAGLFGTPV